MGKIKKKFFWNEAKANEEAPQARIKVKKAGSIYSFEKLISMVFYTLNH